MDFLQERIGDTDIENGLVDKAEKGESEASWKSGMYILYHVQNG